MVAFIRQALFFTQPFDLSQTFHTFAKKVMQARIEEQEEDEMLFEHYRIKVDTGQSAIRIDRFLLDRLPHVSRTKIQTGIDNAHVLVNEQAIKANYKVKPNDLITISLPEPPRNTEVLPENIPLEILYEDDHLLLVNKAAGMVVHPAHGNWSGTLVNALTYHFQNLPTLPNNDGRPGLVHRIDKDTSGILVIAKSEAAMTHLAKQFFHHTIERTYYALVWGEPATDKGTINAPLGRSQKDRRIITVYDQEGEYGKHAITHYEVLRRLRYVSLLKCNLETGRTHQIRAHLKHIGHTLFNDETYGGNMVLKGTVFSKYKAFVENCFKIIPRHVLHAKSLGFIHPATGEKMYFETELPQDFQDVLEKWEHYLQYN
jgi:23S rRNA pseudouridine1911/1915/1917 synthase